MPAARPLRDVFTDLTGEGAAGAGTQPDELLRAQGHEDLGDELIGEALVNFADSAPVELAEHLAQFVMAHSPVPLIDPGAVTDDMPDWIDLLASAPPTDGVAEIGDDGSAGLDGLGDAGDVDDGAAMIGPADGGGFDPDHGLFLDFGHGDLEPIDPAHFTSDTGDAGDAEIGDAGGAGIGDAGGAEIGDAVGSAVDGLDHDGHVDLSVYDGYLAELDGHDSIGDTHDAAGDGGDDGDDADPADTIDA
jgi:hypothetical protein